MLPAKVKAYCHWSNNFLWGAKIQLARQCRSNKDAVYVLAQIVRSWWGEASVYWYFATYVCGARVCVHACASGLTCLCLCVHRCIHLSQVTMMIMLVQRGLNIIFISVRTTGLMVGWMDGWMDRWGRIVDELIWNWWANWKISTQTERWCLGVLIHVLRNGIDTWNNRTCVEAHT